MQFQAGLRGYGIPISKGSAFRDLLDLDRQSLQMLDPHLQAMNADPQPCVQGQDFEHYSRRIFDSDRDGILGILVLQ